MRHFATLASATLLAAAFASSAFAADALDLKKKKPVATPDSAVRLVQPPAPKLDTISIEFGPEFYGNSWYNNTSNNGKSKSGTKDWSGKIGLSHTFDGTNFVAGAAIAYTGAYNSLESNAVNTNSLPVADLNKTAVEGTLAYKFKMDAFTITPGMGLGYFSGWTKMDNTGTSLPTGTPGTTFSSHACSSTNPASANGDCYKPEAYYFFTLAADWKFADAWTWNIVSLRYRDSFQGYWNTPKVSTGLTYNITSADSLYVNAGYSWANKWSHSLELGSDYADTTNITFGYKHAFNMF